MGHMTYMGHTHTYMGQASVLASKCVFRTEPPYTDKSKSNGENTAPNARAQHIRNTLATH